MLGSACEFYVHSHVNDRFQKCLDLRTGLSKFWLQHRIISSVRSRLWDNSGLVLHQADAREAADSLLRHLESYSWLAACMWRARRQMFLIRPKHHCLWHLSLQVRHWRLNLCMFHCFDEESFLGKVKAICQKTHGKTATKRTFQRYTLCLAMLIEQHRRLTARP